MQTDSSRIWTRVAMSISDDDNHYTTGTCDIVVSEFELQSRYYVDFWSNALGNGINFLSHQTYVK